WICFSMKQSCSSCSKSRRRCSQYSCCPDPRSQGVYHPLVSAGRAFGRPAAAGRASDRGSGFADQPYSGPACCPSGSSLVAVVGQNQSANSECVPPKPREMACDNRPERPVHSIFRSRRISPSIRPSISSDQQSNDLPRLVQLLESATPLPWHLA